MALTTDWQLLDDFEFFAQQVHPSQQQAMNLPHLPTVFGVMRKGSEFTGNEIFQFQGMTEIDVKQVKNTLLKMMNE
jgi:hypothetical protein